MRITRAKAELAAVELVLLEVKKQKQQQELKEIAAIEKLKRLKDKVKLPCNSLLLKLVTRIANFVITSSSFTVNAKIAICLDRLALF